jgi:hypothetical protein
MMLAGVGGSTAVVLSAVYCLPSRPSTRPPAGYCVIYARGFWVIAADREALAGLRSCACIIDGEAVACDDRGFGARNDGDDWSRRLTARQPELCFRASLLHRRGMSQRRKRGGVGHLDRCVRAMLLRHGYFRPLRRRWRPKPDGRRVLVSTDARRAEAPPLPRSRSACSSWQSLRYWSLSPARSCNEKRMAIGMDQEAPCPR